MTVLDLLNQPWAITPEKLEAMCEVYDRRMSGVKLDDAAIKAAIGNVSLGNSDSEDPYTVKDGIAVIQVNGVLAKKMNLFTAISGGMSTQMLTQAVVDADADPMAHSILVVIDSPGGEVDGTQQLAAALANCTKPTCAWIDGMAASAALWIATQCDSIYAASDTSQAGSMGVILKHTDMSKANDASGKKVTYIQSGKFKSLGNSDNPLTDDGKDHSQGRIDYLATLFTNAVATGRNQAPDAVWSNLGDAHMCFAQEAIKLGLIDGIASQDEVISMLATAYSASLSTGAQASIFTNSKGIPTMFKTFATEADYNAAITAATEQAVATARVEAATTERNRIQAVQSQQLSAAHSELIATLAFDGKTTGPEAAVAVLAAERKIAGAHAIALAADAAAVKVIPPSEASVAEEEKNATARRDAALAAAPKPKPNPDQQDPNVTASAIADYIQAEKVKGKRIGYAEAAAALAAAAKK
jgi:signal peptide peptidase SppA